MTTCTHDAREDVCCHRRAEHHGGRAALDIVIVLLTVHGVARYNCGIDKLDRKSKLGFPKQSLHGRNFDKHQIDIEAHATHTDSMMPNIS